MRQPCPILAEGTDRSSGSDRSNHSMLYKVTISGAKAINVLATMTSSPSNVGEVKMLLSRNLIIGTKALQELSAEKEELEAMKLLLMH